MVSKKLNIFYFFLLFILGKIIFAQNILIEDNKEIRLLYNLDFERFETKSYKFPCQDYNSCLLSSLKILSSTNNTKFKQSLREKLLSIVLSKYNYRKLISWSDGRVFQRIKLHSFFDEENNYVNMFLDIDENQNLLGISFGEDNKKIKIEEDHESLKYSGFLNARKIFDIFVLNKDENDLILQIKINKKNKIFSYGSSFFLIKNENKNWKLKEKKELTKRVKKYKTGDMLFDEYEFTSVFRFSNHSRYFFIEEKNELEKYYLPLFQKTYLNEVRGFSIEESHYNEMFLCVFDEITKKDILNKFYESDDIVINCKENVYLEVVLKTLYAFFAMNELKDEMSLKKLFLKKLVQNKILDSGLEKIKNRNLKELTYSFVNELLKEILDVKGSDSFKELMVSYKTRKNILILQEKVKNDLDCLSFSGSERSKCVQKGIEKYFKNLSPSTFEKVLFDEFSLNIEKNDETLLDLREGSSRCLNEKFLNTQIDDFTENFELYSYTCMKEVLHKKLLFSLNIKKIIQKGLGENISIYGLGDNEINMIISQYKNSNFESKKNQIYFYSTVVSKFIDRKIKSFLIYFSKEEDSHLIYKEFLKFLSKRFKNSDKDLVSIIVTAMSEQFPDDFLENPRPFINYLMLDIHDILYEVFSTKYTHGNLSKKCLDSKELKFKEKMIRCDSVFLKEKLSFDYVESRNYFISNHFSFESSSFSQIKNKMNKSLFLCLNNESSEKLFSKISLKVIKFCFEKDFEETYYEVVKTIAMFGAKNLYDENRIMKILDENNVCLTSENKDYCLILLKNKVSKEYEESYSSLNNMNFSFYDFVDKELWDFLNQESNNDFQVTKSLMKNFYSFVEGNSIRSFFMGQRSIGRELVYIRDLFKRSLGKTENLNYLERILLRSPLTFSIMSALIKEELLYVFVENFRDLLSFRDNLWMQKKIRQYINEINFNESESWVHLIDSLKMSLIKSLEVGNSLVGFKASSRHVFYNNFLKENFEEMKEKICLSSLDETSFNSEFDCRNFFLEI